MTQGELYKKIEEIDNEKDFVAQDWLRFEADIKPILDEAKKDFPNIDDKKYGSDTSPWIPWNYAAFNRDLLDWFAKWFGSEQP